jgi:hypothetical protein
MANHLDRIQSAGYRTNTGVEFDDGGMEGAIEPFTPCLGLTHIPRTPKNHFQLSLVLRSP